MSPYALNSYVTSPDVRLRTDPNLTTFGAPYLHAANRPRRRRGFVEEARTELTPAVRPLLALEAAETKAARRVVRQDS